MKVMWVNTKQRWGNAQESMMEKLDCRMEKWVNRMQM